jgi:hypothetical protein
MVFGRRFHAPITVWCGRYKFGRDDQFFPRAVAIGQKYVDQKLEKRPSEARFFEELEALRRDAPPGLEALADQLEHRWRHPACPPSLYVVTFTLCAPEGGALVGREGSHESRLLCTKVGKAKHFDRGSNPAVQNREAQTSQHLEAVTSPARRDLRRRLRHVVGAPRSRICKSERLAC